MGRPQQSPLKNIPLATAVWFTEQRNHPLIRGETDSQLLTGKPPSLGRLAYRGKPDN